MKESEESVSRAASRGRIPSALHRLSSRIRHACRRSLAGHLLAGNYRSSGGGSIPASPADERYCLAVAAPILTEGDVMGCVMFLAPPGSPPASEVEYKLAQTAALFLGKQMES